MDAPTLRITEANDSSLELVSLLFSPFSFFSFSFAKPRGSEKYDNDRRRNRRRRFHPGNYYRRQNAISFTDAVSNRPPPKKRADTRRPSSERRHSLTFTFAGSLRSSAT